MSLSVKEILFLDDYFNKNRGILYDSYLSEVDSTSGGRGIINNVKYDKVFYKKIEDVIYDLSSNIQFLESKDFICTYHEVVLDRSGRFPTRVNIKVSKEIILNILREYKLNEILNEK